MKKLFLCLIRIVTGMVLVLTLNIAHATTESVVKAQCYTNCKIDANNKLNADIANCANERSNISASACRVRAGNNYPTFLQNCEKKC